MVDILNFSICTVINKLNLKKKYRCNNLRMIDNLFDILVSIDWNYFR